MRERLLDRLFDVNRDLAAEITNLQLPWYRIVDQVESDPDKDDDSDETPANPQIYIYEEIGGSFGVSAQDFVDELNAIESDEIEIHINSPGGAVFDAIAIHSAIINHPAKITSIVDGLAASAASLIAIAADSTVMMPGSQLMIHDALGQEVGNAQDHAAMSVFLNRQSDNIADLYVNKAGKDVEYWRNLMLEETWLFANEAVEVGLADRANRRKSKEKESTDDATTVANLMNLKHNLNRFDYKYTGREEAPHPFNNRNVRPHNTHARNREDRMIKFLNEKLGSK